MAEAPTFEDLAIDDTLSDLERVQRYCRSRIALQRLVHVRMLADTALVAGSMSARAALVPLLGELASDGEFVVRQVLCEQIPGVCRACVAEEAEAAEGYSAVVELVLPLLQALVADERAEVREAAGEALAGVAADVLRRDDLGQLVLTIVLRLAHDDAQEELRITAVALLHRLADTLGAELCHQFVVPEIVSLSEDPVFRVRKATALHMANVCRTAGERDTLERLWPAYLLLARDDIWGVRKAATESIVAIAEAVRGSVAEEELVQLFLSFVKDASRWVRTAAQHAMGPFVATLSPGAVQGELLAAFLAMAEPGDAELRAQCAFNVPALVLALGAERWGEARDVYLALTRDPAAPVRRTLAHSLHEVAGILGAELAERDLLGTFEEFLRDEAGVRSGVVAHLAGFLQHLGPSTRESYLPVLHELATGAPAVQWRFRELLAKQLPELALLFSPGPTFTIVMPLTVRLVLDAVHVVRQAAIAAVPVLLRRLPEAGPDCREALECRITALADGRSCADRQLFVSVCAALGEPELLSQELRARLFALGADATVPVRMAVARVLAAAPEWLLAAPEAPAVVRALRTDADADVRALAALVPAEVGPASEEEVAAAAAAAREASRRRRRDGDADAAARALPLPPAPVSVPASPVLAPRPSSPRPVSPPPPLGL